MSNSKFWIAAADAVEYLAGNYIGTLVIAAECEKCVNRAQSSREISVCEFELKFELKRTGIISVASTGRRPSNLIV
jgi:DNA integrity scanning protein DisA with diadenylate cyclase activity